MYCSGRWSTGWGALHPLPVNGCERFKEWLTDVWRGDEDCVKAAPELGYCWGKVALALKRHGSHFWELGPGQMHDTTSASHSPLVCMACSSQSVS